MDLIRPRHAAGMRRIAAIALFIALATGAEARSRPPNCTFDHQTEGVTPCGGDRPNPAPRPTVCRPVKFNGIVPASGQRGLITAWACD
jgi:hypothetical protein